MLCIVEAFLGIIAKVDQPLVGVVPPYVDEESRRAVERVFLKAGIPTFLSMDGAQRALSAQIDDPREEAVGRRDMVHSAAGCPWGYRNLSSEFCS